MITWIQFLFGITGLYAAYYLVNILFDLSSGSSRNRTGNAMSHELTFAEFHHPDVIEHVPDAIAAPVAHDDNSAVSLKVDPATEQAMVGSAGVSLKNLFSLAREEAIIYTRPVSF